MSKWKKELNIQRFDERIKCPYCPQDFASNLSLCRHVLREHNWNQDFLKGFEIVETVGSVMVAKKVQQREGAEEQTKSMPLDSESASRVQIPFPLSFFCDVHRRCVVDSTFTVRV